MLTSRKALTLLATAVASTAAVASWRRFSAAAPADDFADRRGYTLVAPLRSTTTYLLDGDGTVVHRWESDATPGHSVELLPDGRLLRTERLGEHPVLGGGGAGGRIREIAWDGTVTWEYVLSDDQHLQHHVVEPLPSGNVLVLAWERKSAEEALAAGRDPERLPAGELWSEALFEVEPARPVGGRVVWEWHVWDHLVQDRDPALPGYGRLADNPGRVDVNATPAAPALSGEQAARELHHLRALGYVGGGEDSDAADARGGEDARTGRQAGRGRLAADWLHANAVAYDPVQDRIALSIRNLSEIWVIDHGTTSEEAKGPRGDLLWRWGNPRLWGMGDAGDRRLFGQHDVQWIEPGLPGAGHLLLFDNGSVNEGRPWSRVVELELPLDETGAFVRAADRPFGPEGPVWEARLPDELFSPRLSGVQRLPEGRTLVCSGERGRLVELDAAGEIIWSRTVPETGPGEGPAPGSAAQRPPGRRPPSRGGPPPRRGRREGGPPRAGGLFRAQRVPLDFSGLGVLSPAPAPAGAAGDV